MSSPSNGMKFVFDFAVTFCCPFLFLSLIVNYEWYADLSKPKCLIGQGLLSWVTGDEEMKTMLRKDGLRWTSGIKVTQQCYRTGIKSQ